jgi:glycosyltransferase involved in cell wall biosynthesis
MRAPPVRVALPCTGLGRQRRGFETFAREVAHALQGDARLEVTVYGGGGDMQAGEKEVWNLPRASAAAQAVGSAIDKGPYFVEQASFFAAFVPQLVATKPDVIYFADLNLGNAVWHWRRLSGQRFRMLFYNGGATTQPYTRCDLVQQVSPEHLEAALARGESAERMVLLPHGLTMSARLPERDPVETHVVRRELGVPDGRRLLLSVGVLDRSIKRMDALVRAVAALGADRPHLVMLGERTDETASLEGEARAALGDGVTLATWPRERMPAAYAAADAFALLSPREGFGMAYLEAVASGLPCVAHDNGTTRYILGPHAYLGDTMNEGVTPSLLQQALADAGNEAARVARHRWAREHFSWDALAPRYAELLVACAHGHRPAWGVA